MVTVKNIAIIKIINSTFHRLSSTEQNQTKQIEVWIVSSFLNINRTYSKIDFKNQLSFLAFMNLISAVEAHFFIIYFVNH